MYNRLRIILFRTLLLSALLFSSGMVLSACQSTASNSTTSSQSSPWAEQAEGVCSSIYDSRGRPPTVQEEKPATPWVVGWNNNMALAEAWHSHLATKTANALEAIPDAPPDGAALIGGLRTYASTSLEMAYVYNEGGYQPHKMAEIESRREPAVRAVQSLSASLNTPSCYSVVNTPE